MQLNNNNNNNSEIKINKMNINNVPSFYLNSDNLFTIFKEIDKEPFNIDKHIYSNKYNNKIELLFSKEDKVNEYFQIFGVKLDQELNSISKVLFNIKHLKFNFDLFTLNQYQLLELNFEVDYDKELMNINLSIRKPLYLDLILNLMNNIYMKLGNNENIESITFSFFHKDHGYVSKEKKISKYRYIIDENIDVLINFFNSLNNIRSIVFSEIDENTRFGELKCIFGDKIEIKDKKLSKNNESSNSNFHHKFFMDNFSNSIDKINEYEFVNIIFENYGRKCINIKKNEDEKKITINFNFDFDEIRNYTYKNRLDESHYVKLMNILLTKLLEIKDLKSLNFDSHSYNKYIYNDNIDLLKELILLNSKKLKFINFERLNPCKRFNEVLNIFEHINIEKLVIPFCEENYDGFLKNKSIKDLTIFINHSELKHMNNIDNIHTFIENINTNLGIPVKTQIHLSEIFLSNIKKYKFMKTVVDRNFLVIRNFINSINDNEKNILNIQKYKHYLNHFYYLNRLIELKKKIDNCNSDEDRRIYLSLQNCFFNNTQRFENSYEEEEKLEEITTNKECLNDTSLSQLCNGFSNLHLNLLNSIKLFNNSFVIIGLEDDVNLLQEQHEQYEQYEQQEEQEQNLSSNLENEHGISLLQYLTDIDEINGSPNVIFNTNGLQLEQDFSNLQFQNYESINYFYETNGLPNPINTNGLHLQQNFSDLQLETNYENKLLNCIKKRNLWEFRNLIVNPDIYKIMGLQNPHNNYSHALNSIDEHSLDYFSD